MPIDVVDLRAFYAAPLGRIAASLRRPRHPGLVAACGRDGGRGLGYATPYLDPFRDEAVRTLAFMPAEQGIIHWPTDGTSSAALVEVTALPLPDASIDRLLLVHMLEPTNTRATCWLKSGACSRQAAA